jgi:hypothetical protein
MKSQTRTFPRKFLFGAPGTGAHGLPRMSFGAANRSMRAPGGAFGFPACHASAKPPKSNGIKSISLTRMNLDTSESHWFVPGMVVTQPMDGNGQRVTEDAHSKILHSCARWSAHPST